ncbi:MAG: Helicase associated domain protein [Verrucomicrobiota bacterium]
MSSILPKIKSLLEGKDAEGLKVYLEGLKATEKGPAFELFLELLYNGNGYTAIRQGGRGDLGADILLYDSAKEGIYCIIQAKNHSSPLNFDDTVSELNKFESKASENYDCREFEIISMNGFVAEAAKLGRFRLNLRDWSYVEGLIETYDPDNKSQPVIRLHSHNQETFDAAIISLNTGSRVACIQATGTGKSYVIAETMNQFPKEKKLVIAPSNYILKQQMGVARWLNRSTKYMTYAAAKNLTASDIEKMNPALIVLDEFHRTGADVWGAGVEKILKQCPDAKVLGTTATPIRHLDGERDMSDELFDEEAVNLPLAEAIQRRILPSPNYVSSLYTLNEEANNLLENLAKSSLSDDEKKKLKGDIEQETINWEKSSGVPEILKKYLSNSKTNKFIVFCKDKKHLDELEDEVRKWIRKTGLFEDRETYRVYSGYRKSDANLEEFLAAKDKKTAHILMAIDMLNEGIHAPDVGAVLLFRPTESPRIFYQQIGRCLQVGTDAEPIIFDFVNNFQSIRVGDFLNDLNEAGEKERKLRDQFGLSADYLPKILVHDECLEILETFKGIDERLGSWEIQFQELVSYKEEYGDCLVPGSWENKQLANWVVNQRTIKKKEKLDGDRIKRLDELGFAWDTIELAWEIRFKELVDYKEGYGDCLVPHFWKENQQLGKWVAKQRVTRKIGKLDGDKIKQLDELGFEWDLLQQAWEIRFQELVSYKEQNGDCLVPHFWKENQQLGKWVAKQRAKRKTGKLDDDRIKRLNEISFAWDGIKEYWEQLFQELAAYKGEYGDCLVLKGWKNKQLASWVNRLRDFNKRGKLDGDKIKRLDELGFVWEPDKLAWKIRFQELGAYKEEHGDCLVPARWAENKQLASWVSVQRTIKIKGNLDGDKIKRMDELGFVWEPNEKAWDIRLQELVNYKEEHGDCLVPQRWAENKPLATWVGSQRTIKKKGKLDGDKIKRLGELGFVWEPDKQAWEVRLQELVRYKEEHGNCLVPGSWKNKLLVTWVSNQRAFMKKGKLGALRIKRLEEIGFAWDAKK